MSEPHDVLAPCAGRVVPLADVPDPVFADEMVGPGVAIHPEPGPATVVAPIAGRVLKIHPHAFVVLGTDGVGVLVHLGINTVRLQGVGFEVLVAEGDTVTAGQDMVRWDPSALPSHVGDLEVHAVVPVVAMDRPAGSVPAPADGAVAVAGEPLFTIA